MREETYVDEDKDDGDDNGSTMGKHFINIVSSVLSPDKVFNAIISILQMRKPSLRVLKYLSCLYSLQVAQPGFRVTSDWPQSVLNHVAICIAIKRC